jgi:hypothetical protein
MRRRLFLRRHTNSDLELPPELPPRALSLCAAATLLALVLAGCSNEEAFIAADHAKCRELGFQPGMGEYDVCLLEVQRRPTTLAAAPEHLRD